MEVSNQSYQCCGALGEFSLSEIIVYHVVGWRNNMLARDALSVLPQDALPQDASVEKKMAACLISEIAFILNALVAIIECVANLILACIMSPCMLSTDGDWQWRWVSPEAAMRAKKALITLGYSLYYAILNFYPDPISVKGLSDANNDSDSEAGEFFTFADTASVRSDETESPRSSVQEIPAAALEERPYDDTASVHSEESLTTRGAHESHAFTAADPQERSSGRLRRSPPLSPRSDDVVVVASTKRRKPLPPPFPPPVKN